MVPSERRVWETVLSSAGWAYSIMVLGAVVFTVGLVGFLRADLVSAAAEEVEAATATLELFPVTTTSGAETAITAGSPATTTTVAVSPPATTTSTLPLETVEKFGLLFATAITERDADFLFDRLHPAVVGGFGANLCRTWIEQEILLLENYRLTGPVAGPVERPFTTPVGSGIIKNSFSAPVTFSFSGQEFESDGGFALVDSEMRWLGQCR